MPRSLTWPPSYRREEIQFRNGASATSEQVPRMVTRESKRAAAKDATGLPRTDIARSGRKLAHPRRFELVASYGPLEIERARSRRTSPIAKYRILDSG